MKNLGTIMGIGFWLGLAAFLIVGLGVANAQYTGAKPYAVDFGHKIENIDDAEIQVTNESEYPMVIALVRTSDFKVVDHAYINVYQTFTFKGLPAGNYKYKAEVRDGGNAYEYIAGKKSFNLDDNICPEGYTCEGRAFMTLKLYYSRSISDDGNAPINITKQTFFN